MLISAHFILDYTNNCQPNRYIQDPIFPANATFRPTKNKSIKPLKKNLLLNGVGKKKKSTKSKNKSHESLRCLIKAKKPLPLDCKSSEEKSIEAFKFCEQRQTCSPETSSFCDLSKMAHPERNMHNYLYDNPNMKEIEYKKTSKCGDILDCLGPDSETWILTCPSGMDVKTILNKQLGKLASDKSCKVECSANRFKESISLACLTPERAAEYQIVCDKVKMIKPVGKIFITESIVSAEKTKSSETIASCSENEENSEEVCASKKIKKKINDQKFTIETTVTVENCNSNGAGDRKKNRKSKTLHTEDDFIPTDSCEPTSIKKKKIKKEPTDDWLN